MKHFSLLRFAILLLLAAIVLWLAACFYATGSCPVVYKTEVVSGSSLAGFVESGDSVRVAYDYYACAEVERGDVVIYNDIGNPEPIIKLVKGVPGDSFMLALSEGGAKIFINGEALMTTSAGAYRVSDAAYQLLSLYERDYQGKIPPGALLILGNLPGGSRDSTRFGFASRENLMGKVVKIMPQTRLQG